MYIFYKSQEEYTTTPLIHGVRIRKLKILSWSVVIGGGVGKWTRFRWTYDLKIAGNPSFDNVYFLVKTGPSVDWFLDSVTGCKGSVADYRDRQWHSFVS